MPILYQNNSNPYKKIQMKNWTEITREEFEQMTQFKKQYEWNKDDMAAVVNLTRLYVNQHAPSCLSCGSQFSETLTQLRSFYLEYKDKMEQILKEKEEIAKTPQPKKGKNINGTTKE